MLHEEWVKEGARLGSAQPRLIMGIAFVHSARPRGPVVRIISWSAGSARCADEKFRTERVHGRSYFIDEASTHERADWRLLWSGERVEGDEEACGEKTEVEVGYPLEVGRLIEPVS